MLEINFYLNYVLESIFIKILCWGSKITWLTVTRRCRCALSAPMLLVSGNTWSAPHLSINLDFRGRCRSTQTRRPLLEMLHEAFRSWMPKTFAFPLWISYESLNFMARPLVGGCFGVSERCECPVSRGCVRGSAGNADWEEACEIPG